MSISSSLVAIALISIYHEASAKECNNNNHGSRCSNKKNSNSNDDHDDKYSDSDDGNSAKKDKTPFVLPEPVPFP